jgi:hypothetical protein
MIAVIFWLTPDGIYIIPHPLPPICYEEESTHHLELKLDLWKLSLEREQDEDLGRQSGRRRGYTGHSRNDTTMSSFLRAAPNWSG